MKKSEGTSRESGGRGGGTSWGNRTAEEYRREGGRTAEEHSRKGRKKRNENETTERKNSTTEWKVKENIAKDTKRKNL